MKLLIITVTKKIVSTGLERTTQMILFILAVRPLIQKWSYRTVDIFQTKKKLFRSVWCQERTKMYYWNIFNWYEDYKIFNSWESGELSLERVIPVGINGIEKLKFKKFSTPPKIGCLQQPTLWWPQNWKFGRLDTTENRFFCKNNFIYSTTLSKYIMHFSLIKFIHRVQNTDKILRQDPVT